MRKYFLFISLLQIEQKVSLESLIRLKLAFEVSWVKYHHTVCNHFALQWKWPKCLFGQEFEKAGTRFLDLPHFRLVIKKCLGLRAIVSHSASTAERWYYPYWVMFFLECFVVYADNNSIIFHVTRPFLLYLLSHSLLPSDPFQNRMMHKSVSSSWRLITLDEAALDGYE